MKKGWRPLWCGQALSATCFSMLLNAPQESTLQMPYDISCDILFGIFTWHIFWHYFFLAFYIVYLRGFVCDWGPAENTLIGSLPWRSGGEENYRIQKCDLELAVEVRRGAEEGRRKDEGGRRKEGGCRQADIKSKHLWCGQALSAKWCSMLSPTPAAKRFWHELWKFGLSSLVVEANRAESWINLLSI